ncbi:MAG: cbb3-type cytochrome oxidase assembly protein CcoS [Rickettsiales bacterium]|nr:cbb3-type cytochrome oxidase assembly protein CcoS [Rickettsiales bacterium]
MSVLIFLIPITLFLGLFGVMAFLWSLKSKQYDDLEGAANRILFDDEDDEEDK